MIIYRKSKEEDKPQIHQLLSECFGNRTKYGDVDNLTNRYLLAFDDNVLIAMTGIINVPPDFYGSEIDWTCIKKNIENKESLLICCDNYY
jgi:hypothetical protein